MDNYAKSANQEHHETLVAHMPFAQVQKPSTIPPDIYRFFGMPMYEEDQSVTNKLEKISKWATGDTETMGDALLKLKHLEIELGIPTGNQTRWDKLFNWVRIQETIEELRKKQKALT